MTPEEKAVVQAAVYLRHCIDAKTAGDPPRLGRLLDTVEALIFACGDCNTERHTCPGCGTHVGHGDGACAGCSGEGAARPPWNPDHPGCAPEECGGSRLDPCDTVMLTRGARHDGAPEVLAEREPTWADSEWRFVLPGDRVRLKGQEAVVTSRHAGTWHAAVTSKEHNGKAWDTITAFPHVEVSVRLEHSGDRVYTFPPSGEKGCVEILCDEARARFLLVQRELNAEEVWPAAAREWNRKALAAEGQPATFRQHMAAAGRVGPRERGSVWSRPAAKQEER